MKKHRLFLWVSLVFFVLTVIACIIHMTLEQIQLETDFADDVRRINDARAVLVFVFMISIIPMWALELSCIRSVYKLLKHKLRGIVYICYLLSAIISFFSFIYITICFIGLIQYSDTILLLGWPVFIVSFILGSMHKKQEKSEKDICY